MRTIPREVPVVPEPRRDYTPTPIKQKLIAYLHGAIHDGTYNKRHQTFRFVQKERAWLELIEQFLEELGIKSWIYREGKERNLYTLETKAVFLRQYKQLETIGEKIAYIQGYFDAEGGVPASSAHGLYIQFCQKNKQELEEIKSMLEEMQIACGVIHTPSKRVDPYYFRFFVRRQSHQRFIKVIGSKHPRKAVLIKHWMKI